LGRKSEKVGRFFQLLAICGIDFVSKFVSLGTFSLENVVKDAKIIEEELPHWETHRSVIDEVRNEFVKLVSIVSMNFGKKILFIFFDDLDRCLPDDTIKLLEAIKNLFVAKSEKGEIANVIFISGINTSIAKFFTQNHYGLSGKRTDDAINYFRKIFNLTFNIPYPVTIYDFIEKYLDELGIDKIIGDIDFVKIVEEELKYFNINSIRKFQNIVNNYLVASTMNTIASAQEKKVILYILILKELSYEAYQKIKGFAVRYPSEVFEILLSHKIKQLNLTSHEQFYIDRLLREYYHSPLQPFKLIVEYLI